MYLDISKRKCNEKRLGVFVFYDPLGQVDDYVDYLLYSVSKYTKKIYIISNCKLKYEGKDRMSKYSDCIYERENIGFDASAYKFFFTSVISNDELKEYDELLLFNDSFYGPFFSLDNIFQKMSNEDVDVWGLTSNANVVYNGEPFPKHIQSFFLVIKNKVFLDEKYMDFWNNMKNPNTIEKAVLDFEIGFARWLENHNYKSKSYLDIVGEKYVNDGNNNPYSKYAYDLIAECRIPILKRKALDCINNNMNDLIKIISFIRYETSYNVFWITNNWNRIYGNRYNDLKKFCDKYSHIYIYGAGKIGKNIMDLLSYFGYTNVSFTVTNTVDPNIQEISDITFSDDDGIIIGVGIKLEHEIYEIAKKYVKKSNIYLWERKS